MTYRHSFALALLPIVTFAALAVVACGDTADPVPATDAGGGDAAADSSSDTSPVSDSAPSDAYLEKDASALAASLCAGIEARAQKCFDASANAVAANCKSTIDFYTCAFEPAYVNDYVACRSSLDCAAKAGDDYCAATVAKARDATFDACVAKAKSCASVDGGSPDVLFEGCVYNSLLPAFKSGAEACYKLDCAAAAKCLTEWAKTSVATCKK